MKILITITVLLMSAGAQAQGNRVLVVINEQSSASKEIGYYYAKKRSIPQRNICAISITPSEKTDLMDYHSKIRKPIVSHIIKNGLMSVDFIVTTKGVPLMDNRGYSVDSMLTQAISGHQDQMQNPYYTRSQRFKRSDFKIFLVTRLDGYTTAEAKALVDRSVASKGKRGKILIDIDSYHDSRPGYAPVNQGMRLAAALLIQKGIPIIFDATLEFVGGKTGLMGYYSWGSNDVKFDKQKYRSNRFLPGAIAETVVSTSARTFKPVTEGQSLIADLIRSGITGVKGYVSEPYTTAMAQPGILFDRYTSGYNLAESFYMASPFICWKDVVIGDPLAAPYAK